MCAWRPHTRSSARPVAPATWHTHIIIQKKTPHVSMGRVVQHFVRLRALHNRNRRWLREPQGVRLCSGQRPGRDELLLRHAISILVLERRAQGALRSDTREGRGDRRA